MQNMGRAVSMSASLSRAFAPLVDLIFPPRCPLCGDAIAAQEGLCAPCWSSLAMPVEPLCCSCARPLPNGFESGSTQCGSCLADPPQHSGIVAATYYNDASRQLVLAYKHGGRIALSRFLGRLIAAQLPELTGTTPILVPVPLHRWRLWRRGFNQSVLLAREIEKNGKGKLCVDALVRTKATPMLGGMQRKARHEAIRGAIAIYPSREHLVKGRDIILVDDVLTSGATTNACVKVLKRAGARSVLIACFARVVDDSSLSQNRTTARFSDAFSKNTTPETIKASGAT